MKRSELKQVIKPIVKECVQEILLNEGLLSNIVSEVAKGIGGNIIKETKQPTNNFIDREEIVKEKTQQANETRKKLLDAIGKSSYNGIDLFEGTEPLRESMSQPSVNNNQNPLTSDGRDPADPGVDISGILALGGKKWKALKG